MTTELPSVRDLAHFVYRGYLGVWYTVTSRRPNGTNVFSQEWDLLIVLDACRVDALKEVADEYEFIDGVDSIWSVGSHSREWIAQTFVERYRDRIRRTGYVTANVHAEAVLVDGDRPPGSEEMLFGFPRWRTLDAEDLRELQLHWQRYHVNGVGVPPKPVTDHAIDQMRSGGTERTIVHYMQPHDPFLTRYIEDGATLTDVEIDGYKALKRGDVSRDRIWEMYLDNLRSVLDEVAILLENVDAERTVITADHGEAYGEWGTYGHPEGFPAPVVKRVPWVETAATDERTYEPDFSETDAELTTDLEQHLADLGYVDRS